jgi:hypothetical protein
VDADGAGHDRIGDLRQNYLLLAMIVETATGRSIATELRRRLRRAAW